jgi:hypothetical protein
VLIELHSSEPYTYPETLVIEHFGGDPVPKVDQPLKSKEYPPKGRKNSIRTNNIGLRYDKIRDILRVMGYLVQNGTAHVSVLQIGASFADFLTGE